MRTRQATTPPAPLVASGDADVMVGAGTMGTTATNAIETHYAGCRFRSRLEARWAVFFDAIGIEWQYEPQGFEIESVYGREEGTWRYLPDFYLPKSNKWVEVKGDANAIETHYAGCRFRSRLVALQLVVGDRHDSYMPMGGEVEQAYLTARRARFEFGETPTPPAKPTRTTARPADAARAELAADRAEHASA